MNYNMALVGIGSIVLYCIVYCIVGSREWMGMDGNKNGELSSYVDSCCKIFLKTA